MQHKIVPQEVFCDDRSLFAKSLTRLDYILEANCQSSWSGGGPPQGLKIKDFHLTYSPTGPQYQSGFWPSFIGCSEFTTSGFTMTGVPLVMGNPCRSFKQLSVVFTAACYATSPLSSSPSASS